MFYGFELPHLREQLGDEGSSAGITGWERVEGKVPAPSY